MDGTVTSPPDAEAHRLIEDLQEPDAEEVE